MNVAPNTQWLQDFFRTATKWVLNNPLLIILIIIIGLWNKYVPEFGLDTKNLNPLRAESVWQFTLQVIHLVLTPQGVALTLVGLFAASFLTMFNTGALLGVFSGNERPIRVAAATALSLRTIEYWGLQSFSEAFFGLLFLLGMWLVVPVAGLRGVEGSIIIGICTAIAYSIWYVVISTGSLIIATGASLRDQRLFVRTLFSKENLPRIVAFYLFRIGAEAIAIYAVLIAGHSLHLPAWLSGILVVIAVSLPFALVRTTGLVMKLDMLREVPWFEAYFKSYYELEGRDRVGL